MKRPGSSPASRNRRLQSVGRALVKIGRNDGESDEPPLRIDLDLGHSGADGRGIDGADLWLRIGAGVRQRRNQGGRSLTVDEGDRVAGQVAAETAVVASPFEKEFVRAKPIRPIHRFVDSGVLQDLASALAQNLRRLIDADERDDARSRRKHDREREHSSEAQ